MERLKKYLEKKADLKEKMNAIISSAEDETRAFTDEEKTQLSAYEKEMQGINDTVSAIERNAELNKEEKRGVENSDKRTGRAIVNAYIRGEELRTNEMSVSSTGSIIPVDFSTEIIKSVKELSGIYNDISIVSAKGIYKQIKRDTYQITAGWTAELAAVTNSQASFDTIDIGHHKLGALAIISDEALAETEFDLAGEVMTQMAEDFALKLETAIIAGTGSGQPYGLTTAGTAFTLAATNAITADEVVKIYHALKSPYMLGAEWLMNRKTLCDIRLLKDSDSQYLFHASDMQNGYAGTILGKPVRISEAMEDIGAGKKPILFGDFRRGYKGNQSPEMKMQQLNEHYATIGAKGLLGFVYFDGRPVNSEAYITVSNAASN